jgi:hypothetical protein
VHRREEQKAQQKIAETKQRAQEIVTLKSTKFQKTQVLETTIHRVDKERDTDAHKIGTAKTFATPPPFNTRLVQPPASRAAVNKNGSYLIRKGKRSSSP